jgi:molybdopterin converting factor small subunit
MHRRAQRFQRLNRGEINAGTRKEISEPNAKQLCRGTHLQIKVHYISLVKSYTGKSQEDIALPDDTTVAKLLDFVAEQYGEQFKAEVYDPQKKEMKQTFVAMVNGVLMDQLKGVDTPLKSGDDVILMSLMTGG